jgi:DNA-binding NarL/FixJ family response regulator
MTKPAKSFTNHVNLLPPLPLDDDHWRAVIDRLQLSPTQAKVTALLLRGAARKEIADTLSIAEPTIKTYLDRIYARTGTACPMQLAMRVLAASHEVRRPKG